MVYSTIVINTIEQTAYTVELHSSLICGIRTTLVSQQSTELSKGHEVVSSRFLNVRILSSKN
jgi:hypothetical protein